ncbi:MAG: MBL fold metallo-hydrolase [Candidatus Acidiferrales bacterium]
MSRVEICFLGSGDAFGSGGRFQTCFLLRDGNSSVLIDCGASSLIAMKRGGLNSSEIGWILLTHLHGDHFGGLPFVVLDGQFSKRTLPLVIAGPPGVAARVEAAMEVFFPGSARIAQRFPLEFVELTERVGAQVGPCKVTPFTVVHPSGAPAYALRVEYGGKVISYSGDTEWTESLVDAAHGADLFICEAYFFGKKISYHLDYATLREKRAQLQCSRVILTHMSEDMLAHLGEVEIERAEDGKTIVI